MNVYTYDMERMIIMTKIDIISGFLGAGKTTLIKKLLQEGFNGEKVVLIENEFGEIGIDGGFLKDAGIEITEMNSGCICCSLVGDFATALKEVLDKYNPDRILIEPSGVGKLSDVINAVSNIESDKMVINSFTAVVDGLKTKMYMKNFGEFYNNQIEHAKTIVISRSQKLTDEKLEECVAMLREHNQKAAIITTPWDDIDGKQILAAMEQKTNFEDELLEEAVKHHHEHEHEHHHDHDGECGCGHHHEHDEHEHHHDHDGECGCGHHHEHDEHEHHHDHDGECGCGHHHEHDEHEHHHDHDGECGCGHHHDHEHHHHDGECGCGHHHDHDADEIFTSWGVETPHKYEKSQIEDVLKKFSESDEYGIIIRAKGMVAGSDGEWIYFDYVPGEYEIRKGEPEYTGRLCVIGTNLNEDEIKKLFQLA